MTTFGRRRYDWVPVCIVIVGLFVYETAVACFIKRHEKKPVPAAKQEIIREGPGT